MKFFAVKHLSALHPVDDTGREVLRKIAGGEPVMIEVRRPRHIKHHRLYWALVSLVWDNMDHDRYQSLQDLHGAIKMSVGLRTRIDLPGGIVGYMPGSIAWGSMDQDQFSAFYERVCDAVAKWFLPGVTSEDLRAEVESMIGIRTPVAAPFPGTTSAAAEAGAGAGGSAKVGEGGPPPPPQPVPATSTAEPPWEKAGLTKEEWEKLHTAKVKT